MVTTAIDALQTYLASVGNAYVVLVDATTKAADRGKTVSHQEATRANNEDREAAETVATYIQETAAAAAELGRAWAGLDPTAEMFSKVFETSVKTHANPSAPREERKGAAPTEDVAAQKLRPQCLRCGKQFVGPAQLAHHQAHADRLCTPA